MTIRCHCSRCEQIASDRWCFQHGYQQTPRLIRTCCCAEEGNLSHFLRALSERLARLVGTGDVGVVE